MLLALALVLALADPAGPVVSVEFVAEDGHGVAIRNLKREEVRVLQDGDVQELLTFDAAATPGLYALSYAPKSGRAGAVNVRLLRGGSRVRGPEGDFLRPRVVGGSTPLEREMVGLLDAATDFASGEARLEVLRFEAAKDGVHHTLAVQVPLDTVTFAPAGEAFAGSVQVLTRVRDAAGVPRYRSAVDRVLEVGGPADAAFKKLVSTADVHLPPGTYSADVLVRDAGSGRTVARRTSFDVAAPAAGLRASSVVILQDSDVVLTPSDDHDPLSFKGQPLMPSFEPTLYAGSDARVRFYFNVYPAASGTEPVTAKVELWRDGGLVGQAAVALPAPDADGVLRHVAAMPTRTFRPADYTLRLKVTQGADVAQSDAAFRIVETAPTIRR